MANSTLVQFRDLYFFLDNNFDELKAACATDDQRNSLNGSYVAARDNFHKAVVLLFEEDDDQIEELTKKIKDINEALAEMQSSLSNIANTIRLIATAVDVGGKLLAMARPV